MPQCAGFLKLNSQMIQKLNTLLGCKLRKGTPNERQKCVGTSSPPQTTLNFEQNGWKWVLFGVYICWGGVRGRRDDPKPIKKFNYGAITWDCFSSGSKVFWPPLLNRKKTISIFFLATLRQLFASHQGVFVPCDHLVTKGPLVHIGLKCVSVLSYDSFASIGSFCWTPWSPDHLFKF